MSGKRIILTNFPIQPSSRIIPVAFCRSGGDSDEFGSLVNSESGKITEFDKISLNLVFF
jgi:hypothetical protein